MDTDRVDGRLDGGMDAGAWLVDGTVRRPVRAWTASVHGLLRHLERAGFAGAPRVLGTDDQGREVLTHLAGDTVGSARPWPAWAHSDTALVEMGEWLRRYHAAVATYEPPPDAVWREGRRWAPGLVVGHGDPAPYNAVWDGRLVGMVDWDDAGPVDPRQDAAWVAFSWTPLHARAVVVDEGFRDLPGRRRRLEMFLEAYGWSGTLDDAVEAVEVRLRDQVGVMRAVAARGDPAYVAMLARGQDALLEAALEELDSL